MTVQGTKCKIAKPTWPLESITIYSFKYVPHSFPEQTNFEKQYPL